MISENVDYKQQCLWFTSLVSKQDSLARLNKKLKAVAAVDTKIIRMAQGNKISRFVAWTFFDANERVQICKNNSGMYTV